MLLLLLLQHHLVQQFWLLYMRMRRSGPRGNTYIQHTQSNSLQIQDTKHMIKHTLSFSFLL